VFFNKEKIFCLSIQRTGTTSVGSFFKTHNYNVAGYGVSSSNKWSWHWIDGNYEKIFSSPSFKKNNVFEDDPWWCPEFYKVLFYRFPKSKFILFTRNSDDWFKSMLSHSKGVNPGNSYMHSKIYRRELDFNDFLLKNPDLLPKKYELTNSLEMNNHKQHYIEQYERHNHEVIDFFSKHSSNSLFIGKLEDPQKWEKLAQFMNIKIEKTLNIHENKTIL
jgi:sulfotransferase family protein